MTGGYVTDRLKGWLSSRQQVWPKRRGQGHWAIIPEGPWSRARSGNPLFLLRPVKPLLRYAQGSSSLTQDNTATAQGC